MALHICPYLVPYILQESVCQSVSQFMAFVHGSVNEMSKVYLANERRYNYTTPKSFLELVSALHHRYADTCDFLFRSMLVYVRVVYRMFHLRLCLSSRSTSTATCSPRNTQSCWPAWNVWREAWRSSRAPQHRYAWVRGGREGGRGRGGGGEGGGSEGRKAQSEVVDVMESCCKLEWDVERKVRQGVWGKNHRRLSFLVQVDDLKEKLAAQEIELKQKNEDADALIKKVFL